MMQYSTPQDAEATYDWPAAIALYEQALSALERRGDLWPAHEAELLTALGRCYWRNAEARPAWRTLMRAITSCRQRSDAQAQARATLEILRIWGPWDRHKMLAEDALDALGDSQPYLRARLLSHIDRDDEAFAIAEANGYEDVLAFRDARDGWAASREGRLDDARRIADEVHVIHDRLGNWEAASGVLRGAGFSTMVHGDLTLGDELLRRAGAYAAGYNLRFFEQLAMMDVIGAAYAQCKWDECDRLLASIVGGADFRADLFRMWIAELRGDAATARALLVDPQRAGGSDDGLAQVHSARAGTLYRLGEHDAARAELEVALRCASGEHEPVAHYLPACVDAIVALCDDAIVSQCERGLEPATDSGEHLAGFIYSTLQGRSLFATRGLLRLRLGGVDDAARHFRDGLAWAEREHCPLEQAACHDGLAETMRRRGDRAAADTHAAEAAALRAANLPSGTPN